MHHVVFCSRWQQSHLADDKHTSSSHCATHTTLTQALDLTKRGSKGLRNLVSPWVPTSRMPPAVSGSARCLLRTCSLRAQFMNGSAVTAKEKRCDDVAAGIPPWPNRARRHKPTASRQVTPEVTTTDPCNHHLLTFNEQWHLLRLPCAPDEMQMSAQLVCKFRLLI